MVEQAATTVLLIKTKTRNAINDLFPDFLHLLRCHSRLIEVNEESEIVPLIGHHNPQVLIFGDAAVSKSLHLFNILREFVNEGGLVILGCLFSHFVRNHDLNAIFRNLHVTWRQDAYHRTDFQISSAARALMPNASLASVYSAKAVVLRGVPPTECLYSAASGAKTQSRVFPAMPVKPHETLAAFKRIGRGTLAYIGDVNQEKETSMLINALCMCELTQSNWSQQQQNEEATV